MNLDLSRKFTIFKEEFEPFLEDKVDESLREASKYNKTSANLLYEVKKMIINGGKRLRPALVYYAHLAANGNPEDEPQVFQIGAALELFHTYGLIHDDVLDKSSLRRGIPTIEYAYRQNFAKFMDSQEKINHSALNAAIIGGDYVHALANRLISTTFIKDRNLYSKIQNIFHFMSIEVHAGQADDTFGVGIEDLATVQEGDVLRMLDYKSGRYSIEKPILMGALLAGETDKNKLQKISQFGIDLGVVFQVSDDLLGMFGKEEETGKPATSDILEGKRTILVIRTLDKANPEDQARMASIIGNPNASESDIKFVKDLVVRTGVKAEIEKFCDRLIFKAKAQILEVFEKDNPGTEFILDLADYLMERKS